MTILTPDQADFFDKPVFPTRSAAASYDFERFRSRIKRSMSEVIRERSLDRRALAQEMARLIGSDTFSKASLDTLTSESKINHNIRLDQFKAFVIASGAVSLWDVVLSDEGLLVIRGDEARLAEIAYWQQEQKKIITKLKTLRARPVLTDRGAK
ncbi:MAG: hypothetical protein H2045_09220 [Rhizobiales bacterium]|nr:hypothetical protein [Hyphomicrobiales bacterium]